MDRFGDYTLLEKVASGGMADIFRAAKVGARGFRKYFAIKRILSHISEDKAIQDMFVKEAHVLSTVSHSNVVQIYELGEVQGQYFIAMDYIEGKNLRDFMDCAYQNGYIIPLEIIVYIFSCIIDGLEYVHQLSDNDGHCFHIVHRDINPNNIILSYNGEVKIIDFGIVKSDIDTEKTKHGVIKGKLSYLSPEQLEGKGINQKTDVFAAGIVFYEMLARKRLFTGNTEQEIFASLINLDIPQEISQLPTPPAIAALLSKLLERDSAKRYTTMTEVKEDLFQFIKSENLQLSGLQLRQALQTLFIEDIADESRKKSYFDQFLLAGDEGKVPDRIEETQAFGQDATAFLQPGEDQYTDDKTVVSTRSEQDDELKTKVLVTEGLLPEKGRYFDDSTKVLTENEVQENLKTNVLQTAGPAEAVQERAGAGKAFKVKRWALIVPLLGSILVILGIIILPSQRDNRKVPLPPGTQLQNGTQQREKTAVTESAGKDKNVVFKGDEEPYEGKPEADLLERPQQVRAPLDQAKPASGNELNLEQRKDTPLATPKATPSTQPEPEKALDAGEGGTSGEPVSGRSGEPGPVQVTKLGYTGILSITGNPAGQTVYINGAAQGQLPQKIILEPGFYDVQCQLDNWKPYQIGVKLRKGKTLDITCNLEPNM